MFYDCSSSKGTESSSSKSQFVPRRSPRKHPMKTEYNNTGNRTSTRKKKLDDPEEPEYENNIYCNNNFTL